MIQKSDEVLLSYFDFNLLKEYAERWVKTFHEVPIRRVALYRFDGRAKVPAHADSRYDGIIVQYAVVFEIPTIERSEEYFCWRARNIHSSEKPDPEKKNTIYEALARFETATEYYNTCWEENRFTFLIDAGFNKVYKRAPPAGNAFRNEWIFIPKTAEMGHERFPRLIMESECILYPVKTENKKAKKILVKPEEKEIIRYANKEALRLWKVVGKNLYDQHTVKGKTLKAFEKIHRESPFTSLTTNMLGNVDRYLVKKTHSRRNFKNHLIRVVLQKKGFSSATNDTIEIILKK
ncbi:MAG: hypothetical protein WCQ99_14720 [Pseudomonadota bacterium]